MTGFEEIKHQVEVIQAAESVLWRLKEVNMDLYLAFIKILVYHGVLQIEFYDLKESDFFGAEIYNPGYIGRKVNITQATRYLNYIYQEPVIEIKRYHHIRNYSDYGSVREGI